MTADSRYHNQVPSVEHGLCLCILGCRSALQQAARHRVAPRLSLPCVTFWQHTAMRPQWSGSCRQSMAWPLWCKSWAGQHCPWQLVQPQLAVCTITSPHNQQQQLAAQTLRRPYTVQVGGQKRCAWQIAHACRC